MVNSLPQQPGSKAKLSLHRVPTFLIPLQFDMAGRTVRNAIYLTAKACPPRHLLRCTKLGKRFSQFRAAPRRGKANNEAANRIERRDGECAGANVRQRLPLIG